MRIGIIGAGNIGSTLATKLTKVGHSVLIANSRGPETLKKLTDETGAKAESARHAVQGVNVVIPSIPFAKLPLLRELIATLPDDVVVADTSNYFPVRDGQISAIDDGQVESLWVSKQIGRLRTHSRRVACRTGGGRPNPCATFARGNGQGVHGAG